MFFVFRGGKNNIGSVTSNSTYLTNNNFVVLWPIFYMNDSIGGRHVLTKWYDELSAMWMKVVLFLIYFAWEDVHVSTDTCAWASEMADGERSEEHVSNEIKSEAGDVYKLAHSSSIQHLSVSSAEACLNSMGCHLTLGWMDKSHWQPWIYLTASLLVL